jgi:hypothetical protein
MAAYQTIPDLRTISTKVGILEPGFERKMDQRDNSRDGKNHESIVTPLV